MGKQRYIEDKYLLMVTQEVHGRAENRFINFKSRKDHFDYLVSFDFLCNLGHRISVNEFPFQV